jgi:hypothetical protein
MGLLIRPGRQMLGLYLKMYRAIASQSHPINLSFDAYKFRATDNIIE